MKKQLIPALTLLSVAITLSGCATLFGGGPKQTVSFHTDQPKAHFTIKDQTGQEVFDGTDPGTLQLPKKNTYTVEITLDGYAKQTLYISQGVNGWFWGNICIGGLVGMAVDFATGSMWDLQPSKVDVKLKTAMIQTDNGYVVTFVTRDDKGQLRSLDVVLTKI